MPPETTKKGIRRWRPEPERTEPPLTGEPIWRTASAGRKPTFGRTRWRVKTLIAIAFFLLFTGLLVYVALWLRLPGTAGLVLIGAGYEDNLAIPANVYGREGMAGLAAVARGKQLYPFWRIGPLRLKDEPVEWRMASAWDRDLDRVSEQTVVLYLGLHGAADTQGPYLFPHDSDGSNDSGHRLRLETILNRLAELPDNKNKVLILDATQVVANWRLGFLHNDFARALARLDERITAIPNLVVLSASELDQRSWVSEDWGKTIFTHFVTEGLRGGADEDGNSRVSALELHRYVRDNVAHWTRTNRDATQTPVLLPGGTAGEERARGINLTVIEEPYQPANPNTLAVFQIPPELVQAWEHYGQLAQKVPAPAAYAPQQWRHYTDLMLRAGELARAGDGASANRLLSRLREVEQALNQAARLQLDSLAGTLTGPNLEAAPTFPAEEAERVLETLAHTPADQVEETWTKQRERVESSGVPLPSLRFALYDALLRRAGLAAPQEFDRIGQMLRVLEDPSRPRPAEMHFIAMIRRDLSAKAASNPDWWTLVQIAIRVRRTAEQAAMGTAPPQRGERDLGPYSESVLAWTKEQQAGADQDRRLGEDHLFIGGDEHLSAARKLLTQAEQKYTQVLQQARSVRNGLTVRDRILAELPYYSQWLAMRRLPDDPAKRKVAERQFDDALKLWIDVHYLVQILEEPSGNDATLKLIDATAGRVTGSFAEIRKAYEEHWLAIGDVDSPSVLREADDALVVPPFGDAQLRTRQVQDKRRISRKLLLQTAHAPHEDISINPDAVREQAQETARRQGRMALAILGRRPFEREESTPAESFDRLQHRLEVFSVEDRWWDSSIRAGDAIGMEWRQLPRTIQARLDSVAKANPVDARAAMLTGDRLARLVDGSVDPAVPARGVDTWRRYRVQEFLLTQARRTWEDHWYADDPKALPYFQVVGGAYLNDLRRLDPKPAPKYLAALEDARKEVDNRVTNPGRLSFGDVPRLHMTSERRFDVECRLQVPAGTTVPAGVAVIWANAGKNLELAQPKADARMAWPVGSERKGVPFICSLTSSYLQEAETNPPRVPQVEQSALSLRGLFRGQLIEMDARVDLHPLANTIMCKHETDFLAASVAVRADRALHERFGGGNGAIAIILDCSGSMGPPDGETMGPNTKFVIAADALRQVLQGLPPGPAVSVWVFGQAMGPEKKVADVERTIRLVHEVRSWNPLDAEQGDQLRAKLTAVEPWNESPIMRTMIEAKEYLRSYNGFKTVVVITDGDDNRFLNDKQKNPGRKAIPVVLQEEFQDTGVVVNFVTLPGPEKELQNARTQFGGITKLQPAGKFYSVQNIAELIAALRDAMRQKLTYFIEQYDSVPVPDQGPRYEVNVGVMGTNDIWAPNGLTAGGYKLRLPARQRVDRAIAFSGGDRLLLTLKATPQGLDFERSLFTREFPLQQPAEDWRVAVLQNQQVNKNALQMLVAMEKTPDPKETILRQIRPQEVWVELKPGPDGQGPFSVRSTNLPGYPAAAWSLDVPEWPVRPAATQLVRPVLSAWWNPDQESLATATAVRGPDSRFISPVRVDDDDVQVESVVVEDRLVWTSEGKREQHPCLVVRLAHSPGKAAWVRLKKVSLAGQEHHFYADAAKYTGVFWPVTKDEVANLAALPIISVNAFKREAKGRGYFVEMPNLPAPDPGDVRPRPIEVK